MGDRNDDREAKGEGVSPPSGPPTNRPRTPLRPLTDWESEHVSEALALKRQIELADLQYGKALSRIFRKKIHRAMGYTTFDSFVREYLHEDPTRADRLRSIHEEFVERLQLTQSELAGLKDANAMLLLRVINAENAAGWLAKGKTLPKRALEDEINAALSARKGTGGTATGLQGTSREHQPPPSQSDRVSARGSTAYESTQGAPAATPRAPRTTDERETTVFHLYRGEGSQSEVVHLALEQCALDGVRSPNEALAHVASVFLAHWAIKNNDMENVRFCLASFERILGGHFVWIKDEETARRVANLIGSKGELTSTE